MARRYAASTELRKAAEQLGLECKPERYGSHGIAGEVRGIRITIRARTEQVDLPIEVPPVHRTRFDARLPHPLRLGLRLTRENFLTAIKKLFGAQDIKVGDPAFDAGVQVQGRRPVKVRNFLNRPRRVRIHRFLEGHPGAVISDTGVTWETAGSVLSSQQLASNALKMIDLAWHLAEPRSRDEAMERSLDARDEGRLDESLALLAEMREPSDSFAPDERPVEIETPRVEERVLEGELLSLADRRQEAKRVFDEALEHAPDDEEVQALAAKAVDPQPLGPEDAAERTARDLADVCKALFDADHSSFETNHVFDAEFRGQVVDGSGPLISADAYSFDLVFGHNPGTRAIVDVARVGTNLLGERKVKAIVQLPPDVHADLLHRKGHTIRFQGTLERADGFMRNIYVSRARLLDPIDVQ